MTRSPAAWFQEGLDAVALSRTADTASELRADRERALEAFEQCLALDPRFPGAQRERGQVLAWLERHEEAVDAFIDAASLEPEDATLRQATATSLEALGRHEAALGEYEAALRLAPGSSFALFGRAKMLTALGRDEAAVAAWEGVLALEDNRQVLVAGAAVRVLGPDFQRAEALVSCALCLSRWRPAEANAAWWRVVDVLGEQLTGLSPPPLFVASLGSSAACREALEAWLERRGAQPGTWRRAVSTWVRAKRLDEALGAANRLVALAPQDSRAWFELAEVHAARGEREDAIAAYERSLALEPGFLGAKARLAVVREQ